MTFLVLKLKVLSGVISRLAFDPFDSCKELANLELNGNNAVVDELDRRLDRGRGASGT